METRLKHDVILNVRIFVWQEYEVGWHCGNGGHRSCGWYSWTTRTVNTRYLAVNMTRYDMPYTYRIIVVTSHGRGKPYQSSFYVDALSGIPGNFACGITKENTRLLCHWSVPTDVNPMAFWVSKVFK